MYKSVQILASGSIVRVPGLSDFGYESGQRYTVLDSRYFEDETGQQDNLVSLLAVDANGTDLGMGVQHIDPDKWEILDDSGNAINPVRILPDAELNAIGDLLEAIGQAGNTTLSDQIITILEKLPH